MSSRTKKSAKKSLLTANCGAFSLRQNSKYPYVSPEPIRFYLRKRRQPETVQNSKPPLVRHVTVTSVGIKLKTQGGYRHRTSDTWRGEKWCSLGSQREILNWTKSSTNFIGECSADPTLIRSEGGAKPRSSLDVDGRPTVGSSGHGSKAPNVVSPE